MTATGTERQQSSESLPAVYHTVTPYLTVKRAEQLVEFVKEAFGAAEVFRTIGSAGGLHAEVTIGDSKPTQSINVPSTTAPLRWKSQSISFTAIEKRE